MKIIITGRIIDNKKLIGYKAWLINNDTLEYTILKKDIISIAFKKYQIVNCIFDKKTQSIKSKISIPISEYPRYNKYLSLYRTNKYTDSHIISITLGKHIEDIRILVCGALIYGAITDPLSRRAQKHAETYYEEIRHMSTDVNKIAKNTNFSEHDINRIKNYLFMESHQLEGGYRRFDPSFDIASSWQRLIQNKIEPHDITLLNHELLELHFIEAGMNQREAHNYAQNQFDYGKEANEYYDRLKKHS